MVIDFAKEQCLNGINCALLDNDNRSVDIVLPKDYKNNFQGKRYKVRITYFDSDKGHFSLYYTSVNGADTPSELSYLDGTNRFVTKDFVLKDADFSLTQEGSADIKLSVFASSCKTPVSPNPVYVSNIEIEEIGCCPIFPTYNINKPGNTFSWFEDRKIISISLKNVSKNDINCKAQYKLYDFGGKEVFCENITANIKAGEIYSTNLDIGSIGHCDVYTLKVEISGYEFTLCELAIIKTDKNGILNDDVYVCSHFDFWKNDDVTRDGVELLKLANIGGTRMDFRWRQLETEKGVLDWNNHPTKPAYDEVIKQGLKVFPILGYGNPFYTGEKTNIPHTEEQLKGWYRYVEYMVNIFGENITRYEIWNEPNIVVFNRDMLGGDVYAKMAKGTTELLHKLNPKAQVGGFCMTYLGLVEDLETAIVPRVYFMQALDTGLCGELDAITIHPYNGRECVDAGIMKQKLDFYYDNFEKKHGKLPLAWNTELGHSLTEVPDEDTKGFYNSRAAIFLKSRERGDINCFYNFEKKGRVIYDREDQFGMVSPPRNIHKRFGTDMIPTRSFLILAGHNYCMAKTENDGIFDTDDGNIHLTRFISHKFGCKVLTVSCTDKAKNVTLNLGCKTINLYDSFGNCEELHSNDGKFTVCADVDVKYLIGHITETELI